MQTVVIVIHLMIVAALIAVVLLQKSEGGGLGMGGGGAGGFMSSRGTTNLLTRTTAILAGGFFHHQPVPVLVCGQPARPKFDHRRTQLDVAARRAGLSSDRRSAGFAEKAGCARHRTCCAGGSRRTAGAAVQIKPG